MSNLEKFVCWYVNPVNQIKLLPRGEGSFVALSVALFLFERYFRIESHSQDEVPATKMLAHAAKELDLNQDFLTAFWNTYRHGLLHQGSPKTHSYKGREYKWRIDDSYEALPTEFKNNDCYYICINPWKFFELVRSLYNTKPENLEGVVEYRLGNVFEIENEPSHQQPTYDQDYPIPD